MGGYYYYNNLLIILASSLLLLIPIVSIQDSEIAFACSTTSGSYTPGSNYTQSLTYLVDDLCVNAPNNSGFRYSSQAEDPNSRAYGLALCRGDILKEACETCLTNATIAVVNSKGAIAWNELCMLKYSNVDFNGTIDEDYMYKHASGKNNYRDKQRFSNAVHTIITYLKININVDTLFQMGEYTFTLDGINVTIYGMVQCTRDLSIDKCTICLDDASSNIDMNEVGGKLFYGSCIVRYELYQFLNVKIID